MRIRHLRSRGRGSSYSLKRGLVESALRVLYQRDWPAHLWGLNPKASHVDAVRRYIPVRPSGKPNLRLGFVSDIHLGPTTPSTLVDRAFEILETARPDVLLLGGDYIFLDVTEDRSAELYRRIGRVRCGAKFAVLGNHDLWTDDRMIERALGDAGVQILTNRAVQLPTPNDDIAIVGLDDPWTGKIDPEAAFRDIQTDRTVVVICHSPDGASFCEGRRVSLFLCGHTHGGQIATPWGAPVASSGRLTRRYRAGFYKNGPMAIYVSRGVGGVEIPMRVGAPADVAILELCASI